MLHIFMNVRFVFVLNCYHTFWILQPGLEHLVLSDWLRSYEPSSLSFEGCPCVSLIKIYQCCGRWAGRAEAVWQALTHSTLSGKDPGLSVKVAYILLFVAWLWLMIFIVDCSGLKYYSTDYQQYVCKGRLTCVLLFLLWHQQD